MTTAFFGATGDCAGYCLANALQANYTCRALARTPSKLTHSMKSKGVPDEVINSHLTIIKGDIRDIEAVKQTLRDDSSGKVVTKIVSGIGGTPALDFSLFRPVVQTDSTLCRDAGSTILSALQELKPVIKPALIVISTTGIQRPGLPRDLPIAMIPLYHWIIAEPHMDKEALEDRLAEHMRLPESERGVSGTVVVKPSLLMGEGRGLGSVRQGVDEAPAVGYSIARQDVGAWMFEKLVKPEVVPGEWVGKAVSITY